MIEEELEEDLDLGEEQEAMSKKKLIMLAGAAFLVFMIIAGASWWFMSGDDEATPESALTEQDDGQKEDSAEEVDSEEDKGPALYHSLSPVFVTNLPPDTGAAMLQVGVDVMVRNPDLLKFIKMNDPMIRHKLLSLFSAQDARKLRKRAGKEKLQQEARAAIQKIVRDQGGPGKVQAVYFTSFVMQ